jgi:hypothetical protein
MTCSIDANLFLGTCIQNNIVNPADSSGEMLVDFDWCALAGEGTYPLSVNSEPICGWHPEVGPDVDMCNKRDDHVHTCIIHDTI